MKLPKLRKKSSGKYAYAFVRFNGKDLILGKWKSKEALKEYQRLIAEYQAEVAPPEPELTVTDVAIHYAKFSRQS